VNPERGHTTRTLIATAKQSKKKRRVKSAAEVTESRKKRKLTGTERRGEKDREGPAIARQHVPMNSQKKNADYPNIQKVFVNSVETEKNEKKGGRIPPQQRQGSRKAHPCRHGKAARRSVRRGKTATSLSCRISRLKTVKRARPQRRGIPCKGKMLGKTKRSARDRGH